MRTGTNNEISAELRGGRHPWFSWLLGGLLGWLLAACAWGAEPVSKEYQLKAAFLYNFTKFVDWPPNRFATTNEPFVIGVLGSNPFGAELAKAVQGRTHNGHAFVVTNLTEISAATNVHLLFVPKGQEPALTGQPGATQAAAVLTVGESEAFTAAGGIITFTTEADKIRFEVNLSAAEQGGVKISSKLLQLAKVVRPKP
jgi:hypothetical protein